MLPEWWLSNSGQVAQWEPEYSEKTEIPHTLADGTVENIVVNPTGYQTVLYVTLVLYIIAAVICFTMIGKKTEETK